MSIVGTRFCPFPNTLNCYVTRAARSRSSLCRYWEHKYGHPIHLMETFVERDRFTGTCYAAAGWFPVGATTGRTRNHPQHTATAPVKEVYLQPLVADFRRRLTA